MSKKQRPSIQGENHYKYKRMQDDIARLVDTLTCEELTVKEIEKRFKVQRSTVYKWLSIIDNEHTLMPSFGTPRSFTIL